MIGKILVFPAKAGPHSAGNGNEPPSWTIGNNPHDPSDSGMGPGLRWEDSFKGF